jgi:folate-binding protein YgfZ
MNDQDVLMREYNGCSVPAFYKSVDDEYQVIRNGGVGIIDLSFRGLIEVSGANAVQFLNGYVTNDIKNLANNRWLTAAFPNVQGRLLAVARILNTGGTFLLDTDPLTRETIFKLLERFVLAGDFFVKDVTNELVLLSLQGKKAREVVRTILGEDAARVDLGQVVQLDWHGTTIRLIRDTHTGEDGFDLFIPNLIASSLWEASVNAGAEPVGSDALERLRTEAGIPHFGVDMDESNIVTEAPLETAVSYTKGCYIGQEIIARIHWRGHVARKLTGLISETGVPVQVKSKVISMDGKEIGRITSSTLSPQLGKWIALAYIKYDYLKMRRLTQR